MLRGPTATADHCPGSTETSIEKSWPDGSRMGLASAIVRIASAQLFGGLPDATVTCHSR